MVESLSQNDMGFSSSITHLLADDEIVVIVDDSPEISLLFEHFLNLHDLPVDKAANGEELSQILDTKLVAVILLDIELPGKSGIEILTELAPQHRDLSIIMVTGTIDIQIALDCLRNGADDYLTKPVSLNKFNHTLYQTLKKRRLAIDNRNFQKQLEITNYRMQFLHNLNLKMNTAHLNAPELDKVLQTILTGITSQDGLKFNRAFLALFDEGENTLIGKLAIGPSSREEVKQLWGEIEQNNIKALSVSAKETDHVLIHSCKNRKTIQVRDGKAVNVQVPESLLQLLDEKTFVVVPLFSPGKSQGVIIADNFVTGNIISNDDVLALEIFASQASLAIEHSHLYQDMTAKIDELELVTQELERNKDMLIEVERYSTLGYISAQLVHAIRNPITSIGGAARVLTKRVKDNETQKFLTVLAEETNRVESTLNDIFHFVEDISLNTSLQSINTILRESVAIFYAALKKYNISYHPEIPADEILLDIDPRKIRLVFIHLIRNSIEAMGDGGELTIELVENINDVTINMIDSGLGVTDSNMKEVTSPFFTTKTYGTGLGLTLVEQILDRHNADFTLQQLSPSGIKATIIFLKPSQA